MVGAAYAVRRRTPLAGTDLEPENGWILFFFVDPAHRYVGLGRRLLTDALQWLRGHGRTRVCFAAYAAHYVLPGLDRAAYPEAARLLASLGFRTRYEAVAMHRGLVGYRVPAAVRQHQETLVARAFRFGTPSDDELVDLLRLATGEFTPDWARAVRQCLAGGAPLDRIVLARAHRTGGRRASPCTARTTAWSSGSGPSASAAHCAAPRWERCCCTGLHVRAGRTAQRDTQFPRPGFPRLSSGSRYGAAVRHRGAGMGVPRHRHPHSHLGPEGDS
ncbi:GNAT family N-acetyltransferase [Streptomyces lydicus]|uniref:GNAT family N-acetyltransferase n=1 Tax=Streptomyces lydicus TaxID=47763 RepID=UPI00379EDA30